MAEDKRTDAEIGEFKGLLDDVRKISEDVKASALDKESVKKMEDRLDSLDKKSEELTAAKAKEDAEKLELKEKIEGLEKKAYRAPAGDEAKEKAIS